MGGRRGDHPAAIGRVEGALGDEGESEVAKALHDVRAGRVELAKVEGAQPALAARLHKAEQSLAEEYLRTQPGMWSDPRARAQHEAIRKAEQPRRVA
jgi:hypothetical protein